MLYGGTGSGQFFYARYQLDRPREKLLIFKGGGKILTQILNSGAKSWKISKIVMILGGLLEII